MLTQVWTCKSLPVFLPDFVDPHISVDNDPFTGKQIYMVETNPQHPSINASNDVNDFVKDLLIKSGFTGVEIIYYGERPDFSFISSNHNC